MKIKRRNNQPPRTQRTYFEKPVKPTPYEMQRKQAMSKNNPSTFRKGICDGPATLKDPSEIVPKERKRQGLHTLHLPSMHTHPLKKRILFAWFVLRQPGERGREKARIFWGVFETQSTAENTRGQEHKITVRHKIPTLLGVYAAKLDRCSHNNTERDECRCRRKHFS